MKLYLILTAVILFSFFSNDFSLVDIQKTAVILAAGIDRTDSGFALTAQLAVPKGEDRTTGGTSSVEIETEGETVSDCVTLIYTKTGWVPKLVFCDLIVIGEEAAKEDVVSYLNYFLRNDYMPDTCLLAVCEGKARDLISSQSALEDTSSLAVSQLFSDAALKSGRVVSKTLKDFAIDYYGVSASSCLPYVRKTEQPDGQGGSSGGAGGGSGSAGAQDTGSGSGAPQIYSAEETALFAEGKLVAVLPREQTLAYNLIGGKVVSGTFNAEEKGKPITLTVIRDKGKVSLKLEKEPVAELSLDLTLRLCCRSISAPIEDIASDRLSDEAIQNAGTVVRGYLEDLFKTCKESGCDLFLLKRSLYRSSLKKFAARKDSLLETVTPEIKVKVRSMK